MKHYLNDFHGKFIQISLIILTKSFGKNIFGSTKLEFINRKKNIFGSTTISRVYKVEDVT